MTDKERRREYMSLHVPLKKRAVHKHHETEYMIKKREQLCTNPLVQRDGLDDERHDEVLL